MKAWINILLLLAIALVARSAADSCACPKILQRVCGKDGVTYDNPCLAKCAGTEEAYSGGCIAGDKLSLPKCTGNTKNCLVAPCSISKSVCKGRTDLVCLDNYCSVPYTLQGYKIGGDCSAVYVTKAKGLVVPGCLPEPDCACMDLYAPVCGVDGKTYGNSCEAGCVKMPIAYSGECLPQLDCRTVRCGTSEAPVCGVDGKTYTNNCIAQCVDRVKVAYPGECKMPGAAGCAAVTCPVDGPAVCGTDGRTYKNECLATCSGIKVASKGECRPATSGCATVLCPASGPAVCGKDGKNYKNECLAKCSGTTVASMGECKPACSTCPRYTHHVCGRDGKNYKNACRAACAGVKVAYKGQCKPPTITTIKCKASDPGARCAANPCTLPNKCKSNENAVCLTNYCTKGVMFQRVKLTKACSAVYVSRTTGVIMQECM